MGWFLLFLSFVLSLNILVPEYETHTMIDDCNTKGFTYFSSIMSGPVKIKCEVEKAVEDKK